MKNNIRYKDNTNNTSVIIFLIGSGLNKNSQRWYFAWENLQEVFVMLVVVVLHSLLFDVFVMLFFIYCFSTSSHALPWAIARFLHPFYTFSLALLRVICSTFILTFLGPSVTVLPRVLRIWDSIFYPQALFTLHSFPTFGTTCFYHSFPGSRQFFLEGCRASHWGPKHRPGPSVWLNHTVFSKRY